MGPECVHSKGRCLFKMDWIWDPLCFDEFSEGVCTAVYGSSLCCAKREGFIDGISQVPRTRDESYHKVLVQYNLLTALRKVIRAEERLSVLKAHSTILKCQTGGKSF